MLIATVSHPECCQIPSATPTPSAPEAKLAAADARVSLGGASSLLEGERISSLKKSRVSKSTTMPCSFFWVKFSRRRRACNESFGTSEYQSQQVIQLQQSNNQLQHTLFQLQFMACAWETLPTIKPGRERTHTLREGAT